jgi:hypothetical protein
MVLADITGIAVTQEKQSAITPERALELVKTDLVVRLHGPGFPWAYLFYLSFLTHLNM